MNEIRTVTLRFRDAGQFNEYARRKGYVPSWTNDGVWQKATVIFQNGIEKRSFMAGWAKESMEDADKNQKFLALR